MYIDTVWLRVAKFGNVIRLWELKWGEGVDSHAHLQTEFILGM